MSSEKEKEPLNCFNKSGQLSLTFIVSILWIIEETWHTPKTEVKDEMFLLTSTLFKIKGLLDLTPKKTVTAQEDVVNVFHLVHSAV